MVACMTYDMADSNSPFWWYQTGTSLVNAHAKPVQLRIRMDWLVDRNAVPCLLDAIDSLTSEYTHTPA